MISLHTPSLATPSESDRRAHDQRISDALGLGPLDIPLSLLRRLPPFCNSGGPVSCVVGRPGGRYRLLDIGVASSYSIAIDLGSTNLVGSLHDNQSDALLATHSVENPQIAYGSDIMTRMHAAMLKDGPEVYRVLRDGINRLIGLLCDEAGAPRSQVHAIAIAGNTAMTHFFLGLDVSTIPAAPFVPVVRSPGFRSAAELELGINPEALVYVFPNAGSYVGGDITAGIIASGMHRSDEVSILIDVGTNAEVVIGNRDWMIVGAGAAGPALEEGISSIGKRATSGIVYDVEINNGRIDCKTFDRATPRGICGSGMVSLLHELFRAGIIDQLGVLQPGPHVTERDGESAFAIDCECASSLSITQAEIQNFMKSKAAMFTLLLVLTRSVGISFGDIRHVYVAGALGSGISPAKAVGIGMLPAWSAEIVKPIGNSSLEGCRMALRDAELPALADEVIERLTYKHMHDDPEFMKEYLGAVFIPHTNPEMLRTE